MASTVARSRFCFFRCRAINAVVPRPLLWFLHVIFGWAGGGYPLGGSLVDFRGCGRNLTVYGDGIFTEALFSKTLIGGKPGADCSAVEHYGLWRALLGVASVSTVLARGKFCVLSRQCHGVAAWVLSIYICRPSTSVLCKFLARSRLGIGCYFGGSFMGRMAASHLLYGCSGGRGCHGAAMGVFTPQQHI